MVVGHHVAFFPVDDEAGAGLAEAENLDDSLGDRPGFFFDGSGVKPAGEEDGVGLRAGFVTGLPGRGVGTLRLRRDDINRGARDAEYGIADIEEDIRVGPLDNLPLQGVSASQLDFSQPAVEESWAGRLPAARASRVAPRWPGERRAPLLLKGRV